MYCVYTASYLCTSLDTQLVLFRCLLCYQTPAAHSDLTSVCLTVKSAAGPEHWCLLKKPTFLSWLISHGHFLSQLEHFVHKPTMITWIITSWFVWLFISGSRGHLPHMYVKFKISNFIYKGSLHLSKVWVHVVVAVTSLWIFHLHEVQVL